MSVSDTIFNRLAQLCSRREYCSRGVLDLLRRKGVGEKDAEAVLERLRADRYVDDARYARAFARDKALLAGWGPRKIAYALSLKGIPEDVVQAALAEVGEDERFRRMEEVIRGKWRSVKAVTPQERRAKVLRFALSRGYDYAEAAEIISSLQKS
ncbi:MAG TPA: RecX family transcriptional regulator [Candidatus Coprenecus merdigallinarum]|nr:RecX family transcriptional regulator [Candidatus Coprenecus merdigallinarum]